MIKKIKKCLKKSKTAAILCHVNADGDALCSSFAIADVLSAMGKEVTCILEEKPGGKYDFLGGEYVVYDHNIPEPFDVCIAVDCGSDDRLGKRLEIFKNARCTINIDHHKSNNFFGQLNVVKPTYCAAAEVIAELFEKMKIRLSDNAARLLYTPSQVIIFSQCGVPTVIVPVLSVKSKLRDPAVSIPTSFLTITLLRIIRFIFADKTTVIIIGKPSGTATTTTVIISVSA
jgi:hypothetical protein